jgi:hypothetical protein
MGLQMNANIIISIIFNILLLNFVQLFSFMAEINGTLFGNAEGTSYKIKRKQISTLWVLILVCTYYI